MGPACWEVAQLEQLIEAGMSVARFDFSGGDHEGHLACLNRLREAARNKKRDIAVMLDTKGPLICTGLLSSETISLRKGGTLILTSDYSYQGDSQKVACSYPSLTSVPPGQTVLIDDGKLELTVLSVGDGEVSCRIETSAEIGEKMNVRFPGMEVDLPTLTEKDIDDIQNWGCKHGVDFVAATLVRKDSDVSAIRATLSSHPDIKIISKIENLEGLQNYKSILTATDGVMICRSSLGMEIPPEKVFLAQKKLIREANIAGKPIVCASQMLESMLVNPRPTRAECSDVANAVMDGADCVMLDGETARGEHPMACVRFLSRTVCEAEASLNYKSLFQAVRNSTLKEFGTLSISESIASSSVKMAIDIKAKAIIVCSESGSTARQIAKFRPGMPIIVLTTQETTARQCNGMLRGTETKIVQSIHDLGTVVSDTVEAFKAEGVAKNGDPIVVVHGASPVAGATNTMKIEYA
jgi:pyruvate kinase